MHIHVEINIAISPCLDLSIDTLMYLSCFEVSVATLLMSYGLPSSRRCRAKGRGCVRFLGSTRETP